MKPFLIALTVLFACNCLAQDATKAWTFKKEFSYWGKWQAHNIFAPVSMPSAIKERRRNWNHLIGVPTSFDSITDNPLRHGATYVTLKTQTAFKKKITLFADLYAEHRGASYGLFNRENIEVYPIMRLEAKDSITIGKRLIALVGKAGQFLDERIDEGLTIYNIDLQGFQVSTSSKSWKFQYTIYGDLFNGIGLNIDDVDHFSLKKEFIRSSVGVSWMISRPPYAPLKNNYTLNVFGRKEFDRAEYYAQVGFRPFHIDPIFFQSRFKDGLGLVIGASLHQRAKRFSNEMHTELRYYGFTFNFAYYGFDTILYRRPAADIYSNYANTTGMFLYPLRKFDTPFSQWAVYTEYQGAYTGSVIVSGNSSFELSKKLDFFLDYDLSYVYSYVNRAFYNPDSRSSSFLYPFFDGGLSYHPAENTSVKASLTNKAMNLDLNYPTHYLLKKPCFQLSILASFE